MINNQVYEVVMKTPGLVTLMNLQTHKTKDCDSEFVVREEQQYWVLR
jgi:hypothetical protein